MSLIQDSKYKQPFVDKKSLLERYGHTPVEVDLKKRFHGGKYAGIVGEGQDRG